MPTVGRLGSKGSSRARTCQAAIKTLRATALLAGLDLPVRFLTSEYSRFQGFVGRHAHWAASIAAQRSARDPALDSAPVRELCPDWATRGARPAKPTRFFGEGNLATSPISAAIISPK